MPSNKQRKGKLVRVHISSFSQSEGKELRPLRMSAIGYYEKTATGFELRCIDAATGRGELIIRNHGEDAIYVERSLDRDFTIFKEGEGNQLLFTSFFGEGRMQIYTRGLKRDIRDDGLEIELDYIYNLPFVHSVRTKLIIQTRLIRNSWSEDFISESDEGLDLKN